MAVFADSPNAVIPDRLAVDAILSEVENLLLLMGANDFDVR